MDEALDGSNVLAFGGLGARRLGAYIVVAFIVRALGDLPLAPAADAAADRADARRALDPAH
jgi:uncharacterized membrane protein